MNYSTPGFPVLPHPQSLLKPFSTESVMPSNHLILCCPLLFLPSIFPSIKVFSNELALHLRWSKYWSFSFSISPSTEFSGLISFRIDWLDLLVVPGTLKSLLPHHDLKVSIASSWNISLSSSSVLVQCESNSRQNLYKQKVFMYKLWDFM